MSKSPNLPSRLLLDTGVLIRALGHKPSDARSPACRRLLHEIIEQRKTALVAAPTIAELERGLPDPGAYPDELPRVRHVLVVAFDERCANVLATKFANPITAGMAAATGVPHNYIKYDAMIVACAVRWEADHLVTLDNATMRPLAAPHIRVLEPADYFRAEAEVRGQGQLALTIPQRSLIMPD
jgi:predicted nucleic acid-binding protein